MMPSESETLGFVALEAMASGLPVVAVAAGGLTDILTNPGVTGQLFTCQAIAFACLLDATGDVTPSKIILLYATCSTHQQACEHQARRECIGARHL